MERVFLWLLRRRLALLLLGIVLALAGWLSWRHLPIDAFPDATNQQVMILTEAEGLGPLDVEQQVTYPVEWAMGGVPGVRRVRSLSRTGLSQVVVVFDDDTDTYLARQLVAERLALIRRDLPAGVEPTLGPISTGLGEVFQYVLTSRRYDLAELRTLQDWLVAPRLRMLRGVNEVNSMGGCLRQWHVLVEPSRLLAYRLTLPDVVAALADNNANAAGGFIVKEWEQFDLRTVGLYRSAADLSRVVLKARDGTPVYLSDLAEIRPGCATRQGAVTRDGGGEVVAGMVIMLKGENSREVVERIKATLPDIRASLPREVELDVYYDRTELVDAVVGTVGRALFQGGLLVVLVMMLFLGSLRTALVAALSLPITGLVALILMDASSLTANLMSLGGLAIAIGMVVDGSIVVCENAIRHREEAAATDGSLLVARALGEVARPIAFSVAIIALVFLPLLSLEGMEGKMFRPLALTLIFAMLGSLVAALVFVPGLLAWLVRPGGSARAGRLQRWQEYYRRLLSWLLDRPRRVLAATALLLAAGLAGTPWLGTEFLPELDEGAVAINVVRLPNASLPGSLDVATFLERQLREFPEVRTVVTKTGRAEISEDPMGPEQSDLLIMLHPESQWTSGRSKEELVAAMRERLQQVPGLRFSFSQPIALRVNELISGVKSDLAVKLFGPDLEVLKQNADRVAAVLRQIRGARDVRVEQVSGFSRLDILPDRAALARHQVNLATLNQVVEIAMRGQVATWMVDGPRRFAIQVRYPERLRSDVETIAALLVPTPQGSAVPLGHLARIEKAEGPAQVSHEQGMRRVVVEANVSDRDLGGFVTEARERLRPLRESLPPGYWIEYGGTFENQQRAMGRLAVVVPLAVLVIFVMLVLALGSLAVAGLVLVALPLALVGGVAVMLLSGQTLNVSSTVGFIALFGIAVQNGTVLTTFINQLRQRGHALREAVVEASSLRLRALLMTAATTVLGLLPMVWASGPGAEIQRPLAIVVIGGLVTSSALTLLVLPALYYWLQRRGATG